MSRKLGVREEVGGDEEGEIAVGEWGKKRNVKGEDCKNMVGGLGEERG